MIRLEIDQPTQTDQIIEIEKCVGGYLYYQLIPYFEAENLLNPKIKFIVTFEACGGGQALLSPFSWEDYKMRRSANTCLLSFCPSYFWNQYEHNKFW